MFFFVAIFAIYEHIEGEVIMKFAHEYEAALRHEAYPDHWIQTAISYRQLKKCINKFQIELSSIGLDADTLKNLWHFLKTSGSNGVPFQYQFEGGS